MAKRFVRTFIGSTFEILEEHHGYYRVSTGDGHTGRVIKGTGETLITSNRGRPRRHQTNAERQKAYRARKKESVTKFSG